MKLPKILLAPMAGVTDLAFRLICREFGADMAYTEMISAKALCFGDKKTKTLLNFSGEASPRAVQLFGSEPETVANAALMVENNFDVIDINMGCPAPKITGNGEGSALLKNLSLAGKIIEKTALTATKPVTVKIRRGYTPMHDVAVEAARIAENCGAAAIAVHGRFTSEMFSGKACLDAIAGVKNAVKIPVIGNGDIFSADDAVNMFDKTGCDAVMIGRGALGNPFIFREIKAKLSGLAAEPPSVEERIKTAIRNVELAVKLKGEHIGILESRKTASWYLKGIYGAAELKRRINSAETLPEMTEILSDLLQKQYRI